MGGSMTRVIDEMLLTTSTDNKDLCKSCIYYKNNIYDKCIVNYAIYYQVTNCYQYKERVL